MRLVIGAILALVLGGCLQQKYTVKKDDFTGETIQTAMVGASSRGLISVVVYAQLEGYSPYIVVYVINTGAQWATQVDFLVSSGRFSVRCGVGVRTVKAMGRSLKSKCPLTTQQARQLAQSNHTKWRVGGVVGSSSPKQLRDTARVFADLSSAQPAYKPPTTRRRPRKREEPIILKDPLEKSKKPTH